MCLRNWHSDNESTAGTSREAGDRDDLLAFLGRESSDGRADVVQIYFGSVI